VPTPPPVPEPIPEPAPVPEPDPIPVPEPEPTPAPVAAPEVEETTVLPGPVPVAEPELQPASSADPVGAPLFVDELPPEQPAPTVAAAEQPIEHVEHVEAPKPPKVRKERTPLSLPKINPRIAAMATGLVVGLVGVVLSFGASQGCEAVRGVGSCGGSGLFALLAVLIIEVLLGAALLKAFGLTDPTSTSFLGVGLVAVIALLFFLSSLESVWMLLVIPVLTGITFVLSWWVTETFVEQGADDSAHR
jgi:hypothetical protein